MSLWLQSLALLQPAWPTLSLQPDDFASLDSAQQLFLRLLSDADHQSQLELLASLLQTVWRGGAAFMTAQVRVTVLPVFQHQIMGVFTSCFGRKRRGTFLDFWQV